MGSIGSVYPKGTTTKAIVENLLDQPVLASAMKNGVFYGVIKSALNGKKTMFVSPITRVKAQGGYYGGGTETIVKLQDESMGPYDAQCPDRLLDMLDEPYNDYAAEWRQKCREYNQEVRDGHTSAKGVKEGTRVEFAEPLFFGKRNGSFKRFRYSGVRNIFLALDDEGHGALRVNLGSTWKTRSYKVVAA